MLVYYLTYPSTLMMEAKCASETSVDFWATWCYIPKRCDFVTTAVRTSDPKIVVSRIFFLPRLLITTKNCLLFLAFPIYGLALKEFICVQLAFLRHK
jgi:hypothetical protein